MKTLKFNRRRDPVFYHGTSSRSWRKHENGPTTLYLSRSLRDACSYAGEEADRDAGDGYRSRPVVLAVRLADLKQAALEFGPDTGWLDAEGKTWLQSVTAVGSFSATGDIERLKRLRKFRQVPC